MPAMFDGGLHDGDSKRVHVFMVDKKVQQKEPRT